MRRWIIGIAATLLVLVVAFYLVRAPLTVALMERQIAANLSADPFSELDDGLHVALCGAGGPMPDPKRVGPCVAVIAGQHLFVFDSGTGSSRNFGRMRLPLGRVEAVFLTHFHSDHIDGLGELMMQRWVNGAHTSPLPVYGPEGVAEVVAGFNAAYEYDSGYRTAHHSEKVAPTPGKGGVALSFAEPRAGAEKTVYNQDGIVISAFKVIHDPVVPAVGYKITYKDRAVVITGDTSKSAEVERMATGADVLVHEALSKELVGAMRRMADVSGRPNIVKIMDDILDYHASPVEAAETAEAAGVGYLLYYHVVPPLPAQGLEDVFTKGVGKVFRGTYAVGRDGLMISLPAASKAIERNDRF